MTIPTDVGERLPHTPRFEVELLDIHNNHKRWLHEFISGTMERNLDRSIVGTCSLLLGGDILAPDIDIYNDHVRVWAVYDSWEHRDAEVRLVGTFMLSVPERSLDFNNQTEYVQVDCFDTTLILEQDMFGGPYVIAQGTDLVQAMVDIVLSTGAWRREDILVTRDPDLLPADTRAYERMFFNSEMTKRQIIVEIAQHIGYARPLANHAGQIVIAPRNSVHRGSIARRFHWRTVQWDVPENSYSGVTFSPESEQSILAAVDIASTWFNAVNVIVLHGVPPGTEEDEHGRRSFHLWWVNDDPNHPFSIPRRQRRIVHVETDLEVGGLRGLRGIMRARAEYNLLPIENVHATHTLFESVGEAVPTGPVLLDVQDRMGILMPGTPGWFYGTCRAWSVDLVPGALVNARWRLDPAFSPNWREIASVEFAPGVPTMAPLVVGESVVGSSRQQIGGLGLFTHGERRVYVEE